MNRLASIGWLLVATVLCSCVGPRPDSVGIVIPNDYEGGSFVIRECRKTGRPPNGQALGNYGDWYWEFSEVTDVVYVEDIRPMMNAAKIWAGWAHVAPIDSFHWEKDQSKREIRIRIDELHKD